MSKHTPGPWAVDDNHGKRYIEPICSNEPIAEICKKKGDEYIANARLIAAAPDLLEALECLIKSDHDDVREMAIAAIAKAKGEQA